MPAQHIVVDGSNIATEGRSAPSLAQLETAVTELKREHPDAEVTVIVDATFSHRIDQSELDRFERAVLAGEYVHPPAGAIGRGDAFLLRVAEKVDGTVLSNDSFQEFHGEHPWLFERGRLLGATPVPGIGWIFSPRTPVRGPTSRKAVRDTEKAKRQVTKAIKVATKEAVAPAAGGAKPSIGDRRVLRRVSDMGPLKAAVAAPALATVNDPLTFVSFIAEHPLGAEISGKVESYTSHGAVVMVGNTQCYVPLANLGHPAPRSAREVLKRGDEVTFVVRALDPQRRGVELALPGVADVSGKPSAEMIEAEMQLARKQHPALKKAAAPVRAGAAGRAASPGRAATPGKGGVRRKAPTAGETAWPATAALPAKAEAPGRDAAAPAKAGARARKASGAKKAAAAASATTSQPSAATATGTRADAAAGPRRAPSRTPRPATTGVIAANGGAPGKEVVGPDAPQPRKASRVAASPQPRKASRAAIAPQPRRAPKVAIAPQTVMVPEAGSTPQATEAPQRARTRPAKVAQRSPAGAAKRSSAPKGARTEPTVSPAAASGVTGPRKRAGATRRPTPATKAAATGKTPGR